MINRPGGRCVRALTSALRRFAPLTAAVLLLATLQGCWSYQSGEQGPIRPVPPASLSAADWPPRDPAPIQALLALTPGEIHWLRPRDGVKEADLSPEDLAAMKSSGLKVVYKAIHGKGLLRIVEPLDPRAHEASDNVKLMDYINFMTSGFTPNAYWMTSKTLEGIHEFEDRAMRFHAMTEDEPGVWPPPMETGTTESKLTRDVRMDELHLRQGMYIRFPKPASQGEPYRGIVLHLNAMFGNEYEVRTLDEFRDRGWAVIDLKPTSQIAPPVPKEWASLAATLQGQRREIIAEICRDIGGSPRINATSMDDYSRLASRFRAHRRAPELETIGKILARCEAGAFITGKPKDYPEVAAAIAGQLDQAQAGSAYAAEAVMDYVRSQRRDLDGLPVVLVGFSAGGLAAPTTAARIINQLSAVVIIGGGADCFSASQLSTFNNGGLHVRSTPEDPLADAKLPEDQVPLMSAEYLKASKLDPYHTAPLLAGLPVLLVTGKADTWVPSACGDLLWERLGKPDRLQINAGHELLFYFLPNKAGFIVEWVERHVPTAVPATRASQAGQGS